MPQVSEAIVEQVFDVLVESAEPITARTVAGQLGLHPTTTGDALRQLMRREVAERVVGQSTHGHPPYLYSAVGKAPTEPASAPVAKKKSRTKRGSMHGSVETAVAQYSPSGRGFTIAGLQKKIGHGSLEAIRVVVNELVATGAVVKTDRCRKGSRVFLPTAATPPAPVTTPSAPAVPANLSGLEALIKERSVVQKTLAASEARLVEIDLALDKARDLLA